MGFNVEFKYLIVDWGSKSTAKDVIFQVSTFLQHFQVSLSLSLFLCVCVCVCVCVCFCVMLCMYRDVYLDIWVDGSVLNAHVSCLF